MNLVVLDLEWNQAMSSKSEVFNHLPIHLRGEIIEIGAVKLNPDLSLGEEFTADVRPVYFRRMHYKVKKITGFDKDRLARGMSFPEAMEKLRSSRNSLLHIPLLFLTEEEDEETVNRGLSLGAMDFIRKPVVPGSLVMRIKHMLELVYLQGQFSRT